MMCNWGDEAQLTVPIPGSLSHTGMFRWATKGIDRCIAPIVSALNNAGIYTASSCCGHGKGNGFILLHDGRELIIRSAKEEMETVVKNRNIRPKPTSAIPGPSKKTTDRGI